MLVPTQYPTDDVFLEVLRLDLNECAVHYVFQFFRHLLQTFCFLLAIFS